jgi:hypothetical protein
MAAVVVAEVVAVGPDAVPARSRSQRRRSHLRHRPPGNRFRIPCWNWSRPRPRFRNPIPHQPVLQLPPRRECIPAPPASTSIQRPSKGPRAPSRKLLVFFARIPLDCVEPRPIRTTPAGVLPRTPGRDYDSNSESVAILIRYYCGLDRHVQIPSPRSLCGLAAITAIFRRNVVSPATILVNW